MLKSIQWDIYTILMVGLVPAMLLTAWGATWWEDHRLHQIQCEMAVEWLVQSSELAPTFAQAGTVDRTMFWQTQFEELESPQAAGQLRWGIIQTANYNREYYPNLATDDGQALNPKDGLFSRDIVKGTKELVEHCPKTEAMLVDAFPMVFRQEDFE